MRIRAGETDPLERKREARETPTIGDGLRRFFDEFAPARLEMGCLSPRTVADYRWMDGRFLEPVLGKRKIADVTRDHIEPIVSPLPRAQRNRLLALTSRLFNLLEQ